MRSFTLFLFAVILAYSDLGSCHTDKHKTCGFTPWYNSTLLSFSPVNLPAKTFNLQPYFFSYIYYGNYSNSWSMSKSSQHEKLNYQLLWQNGITKNFEIDFVVQGYSTFFHGQSTTSLGDSSLYFLYQLLWEDYQGYRPGIRVFAGENFPSGKDDHLKRGFAGFNATGTGLFQTSLGIAISKNFCANNYNPFRINFNFVYYIPSSTHTKGLSVYSPANSKGKANVGFSTFIDFAIEYCFTQRLIFTGDLIYTHFDKVKFKGSSTDGQTSIKATVPSSDLITFCPGLEYSLSSRGGLLFGVNITVAGRNTNSFACPVGSFTYMF